MRSVGVARSGLAVPGPSSAGNADVSSGSKGTGQGVLGSCQSRYLRTACLRCALIPISGSVILTYKLMREEKAVAGQHQLLAINLI